MYFPIRTGFGKPHSFVHAVDDVSFVMEEAETFGLVGEAEAGRLLAEGASWASQTRRAAWFFSRVRTSLSRR